MGDFFIQFNEQNSRNKQRSKLFVSVSELQQGHDDSKERVSEQMIESIQVNTIQVKRGHGD